MDDIVTEDLSKLYSSGWPGRPPFVALDGLSLTVETGRDFRLSWAERRRKDHDHENPSRTGSRDQRTRSAVG